MTMTRRALAVLALLGTLLSSLLATPAHASGNDYPYLRDTTQSSDPWGFTKRQCVSFAAWELKQHGHPISNRASVWGNANHWDEAAKSLHVRMGVTPTIQSIAQWNSNERSAYYPSGGGTGYIQAGGYGHVGVVIRIYPDKSVLIEQYNMSGNRGYSTMHVKAPRYLYIGQ
jgi:surface antigen